MSFLPQLVRENPSIKAWFSGHFHLSHDYEDSITFPGGNNRGSAVFAQVSIYIYIYICSPALNKDGGSVVIFSRDSDYSRRPMYLIVSVSFIAVFGLDHSPGGNNRGSAVFALVRRLDLSRRLLAY